jgi:hypothetical protein
MQDKIPTYDLSKKFFERAVKFQIFDKALKYRSCIRQEINSRFQSGNTCCHFVQNILSASLLSKYINIKIHRNIIWPVVLYGCENFSLTLKEKHGLEVFENRVLRKILGYKREGVTGNWRNYITRELLTKYNLGGRKKKNEMDGRVACTERERSIHSVMGKPEGKRTL